MMLNNFVQATPVCAILLVLRNVPGVPDENRSVKERGCLSLA